MSNFPAFMREKNNTLKFLTSLVFGDVNIPAFEFWMHMVNFMQISYSKSRNKMFNP